MPGRNEVHRVTHTRECPDAYNFVGKDKIAYFFLTFALCYKRM